MRLRRYIAADAPKVWALNGIPNIGQTSDSDLPLDLPVPDGPPRSFPGMADPHGTFIEAGGEFLVGELDGHLAAMGGITPNTTEQAEVRFIRVHPALRRRSLGRTLMQALEARAVDLGFSELHLDTATNQPEAVAFYRSLGYLEVGQETRPEWSWTLVYFAKSLD